MKIGEIALLTNDVIGLSNFYKTLFGIDNNSDDDVIQFIITEGTGLTIYNDGVERKENYQNICLAFTVDDVDIEYERLKTLGIKILEPPTVRPWGAKNMIFADPEGNQIIFRCIHKR